MNLLKLLVAGTALGIIAVAFRDFENGRWLVPTRAPSPSPSAVGETEPVLGYDGMDTDTLIFWLQRAELDADTLQKVRAYEEAHRGREPVLSTIGDLLG